MAVRAAPILPPPSSPAAPSLSLIWSGPVRSWPVLSACPQGVARTLALLRSAAPFTATSAPPALTDKLSVPQRSLREGAEYWAVRALVAVLGALPRKLAHGVGAALGHGVRLLAGRLRRTGRRNLELAFPNLPVAAREQLLRQAYRSLGRHLAEFCRMAHYDLNSADIRYEGLEHFLAARDRGRGVLVLTGHLGAWELSSFFHSLAGYPMSVVIRRLDNARLDNFVNGIRCLHGNRVLHKDDFARGILSAMHRGETVGILMDTNMTPPQGIFVPFFGHQACTAAGLARIALRSSAAVLPGFLLWHADEKRYVLHFGPELALFRTGDAAQDVVENTALFNTTLEGYIRRFPEQWLWLHRRWKTRPQGESSLYA